LIFLVVVVVLIGFSSWINSGDKGMIWLRLQWLLGLLFLGYAVRIWFVTPQKLPKIITYSFLMIFFLLSSITYHISLPHQGQQAKDVIGNKGIAQPIGFQGNLHVGTKIRMSLGPEYDVIDLPVTGWKEKSQGFEALILEDKFLSELDTSRFEVTLVSRNWESKAILQLLLAYHSPQFEELLEENSKKYFLLRKK
jgi:hypothetical protein